MKAFVLAGGAGTRLSPLTSYVPKGMIPIGGKPFIDYVVSYLSKHGVRNLIMLLSDADSEVFRNHLDDGSKFGVNIGYSITPRMGTAAALKEAAAHVDGTFVVYYGDVLTDLDLSEMIRYHKAKGGVCTLALSTGVKIDYGVGRVGSTVTVESNILPRNQFCPSTRSPSGSMSASPDSCPTCQPEMIWLLMFSHSSSQKKRKCTDS